ncbi:MAG: hypothetical protein N4A54_04995 [Peptostreptococcaceae bacterium]|jgi:hypothetical protein|nr:hypothetical protein [Peptostreptococcaceae bacterium]
MNKIKTMKFILVIIIFISVLSFLPKRDLSNGLKEAKFLPASGYLGLNNGESFSLRLDFLDNKVGTIKEDDVFDLFYDNKDLAQAFDIKDCEITDLEEGTQKQKLLRPNHKKCIELNLALKDNIKDIETIEINKLKINDKVYKIGDIKIAVLGEKDVADFDSVKHVTNINDNLNNYYFASKCNCESIKIKNIYLDMFDDFKEDMIVKINDKEVKDYKNIELKKGDEISINIALNKSKEYHSYMFAPVIEYKNDEKTSKYSPNFSTYFDSF